MKKSYKILVSIFLTLGLFLSSWTSTVSAHQAPANCTNNDFVVNLGKSHSLVYDETSPFGATVITYTVDTGNPNSSGTGCDVGGVEVNLTTPDGVVHNLQSGGAYPIGTAVSLLGTVNYTADSSYKVGSTLAASVSAAGDLHDISVGEDPFNIVKQVQSLVMNPTTITTISSSAAQVTTGGTVDLTVTEQNDGDVDLTSAYVDVDNGVGTLSAPPTSGDDADGILEPGETWSWTVLNVVVNADTTFTATGHGTDPLLSDITYPGDPEEQDTVDVVVMNPTTIVSISSSASQVTAGGTVDLTVTEQNDGDVDLTGAYVDVDNGVGTLSAPPDLGDDGDSILEPGETWSWSVLGVVVNADTTFMATGHGTDPLNNDITYPNDPEEQDSVVVDVINPSTILSISASEAQVISGGTVDLTVTEQNDGDVALTNAHVDVDNGVGTLSAPPTSGDDGDGILEPEETWSWTVLNVVVNADTTFMATGFGTDPLDNEITYPGDSEEQDSVTVTVEELLGCTLTQGYWKTHSQEGPAPYDSEGWGALGDFDADGSSEEEGEILAYNITWYTAFHTAPKKGNVWYQLAHQWMAAYLNIANGADSPSEVDSAIADGLTWLKANDPATNPKSSQAGTWAGILADFNEGSIGPGHCTDVSDPIQ